MAKPATILGTQVLIKIGDGASPEVFTHPCLINSDRGLVITANGNKIEVPDCDDPDAPAWVEFVKQTLEATINGAGKLDAVGVTIASYMTWLADDAAKNVRIYLNTIGYFAGAFHLTNFEITGNRGQKAEVSLRLESDGVITWTSTP